MTKEKNLSNLIEFFYNNKGLWYSSQELSRLLGIRKDNLSRYLKVLKPNLEQMIKGQNKGREKYFKLPLTE